MKYTQRINRKQKRRLHDQRGMTFVEVLITMGLLSILLVLFATLFTASIDVQVGSHSYSAVSTDGRFVLARLDYDIARASAVTTPASLGSGASSLALTISGGSYTYSIANGRLQLVSPAGTDYLTSDGDTISSLTFTKLGNIGGLESVQYSFTLTGSGTRGSDRDVQVFSSTAERRS